MNKKTVAALLLGSFSLSGAFAQTTKADQFIVNTAAGGSNAYGLWADGSGLRTHDCIDLD